MTKQYGQAMREWYVRINEGVHPGDYGPVGIVSTVIVGLLLGFLLAVYL